MRRTLSFGLFALVVVVGLVLASAQSSAQQAPASGKTPGGNVPGRDLIVFGDLSIFWGPSNPENCILKSRYKRGEPVGFRVSAIDPKTGDHVEPEAELFVHLSYAGTTHDVKMRWRATAQQPERQFWVAKWVVPMDAPPGIVRYTVTAKDKLGRTGEFKPYEVDASQLTVVE